MTFTILNTSNEIEDICIAYGLCKILADNDIEFLLKKLKSKITINTDDFDIEELEWIDVTIDDCYNINSNMNSNDIKKRLVKLNDFMSKKENLCSIFKYYISLNENDLIDSLTKKCDSIGIGNCYYSLGKRAKDVSRVKPLRIPPYIKNLSFTGWVYGVSYICNDNIETSTILIPKETSIIYKPYEFTYKDEDTEEIKIRRKISGTSNIVLSSRQYIETLRQYNFIKDKYDKIIFMQLSMSKNKPLADKSFELPIYNWDNELLERFSKILYYSTNDYDVKEVTANFILDTRYINFSKLIKMYSKKEQIMDLKFKEELLGMYTTRIQEIYNNEIVNKLGRGLHKLLYNKRGFTIQTQLYNVMNAFHLQKCIRQIVDEYSRVFKFPLITNEELIEIVNFIQDKKEAKICTDAILAMSKVFIGLKNNNNNRDKENNKEVQ